MKKLFDLFLCFVFLIIPINTWSQSFKDLSWNENLEAWGYFPNTMYVLFEEDNIRAYVGDTSPHDILIVHTVKENDLFFGPDEKSKNKFLAKLFEKVKTNIPDLKEKIFLYNDKKPLNFIFTSHYAKNFSFEVQKIIEGPDYTRPYNQKEMPVAKYKITFDSSANEGNSYAIEDKNSYSISRSSQNSVAEIISNRNKYVNDILAYKKKVNEELIVKEQKRLAAIAASRNNPSGVELNLDATPKGNRKLANEMLLGKEYSAQLYGLFQGLNADLKESNLIKVLNSKKYFKDIFYGKFEDLKPEKTNYNLLGSKDYFPEFHNAFLFYAYQKFGENYFPNMILKSFEIETFEESNYGGKRKIGTTTYKIYVPNKLSHGFSKYLKGNQFSWSGEQFHVEFEWLILSFFDQYGPDSFAFKQMIQNVYRYANQLEPAKTKADLVKL